MKCGNLNQDAKHFLEKSVIKTKNVKKIFFVIKLFDC